MIYKKRRIKALNRIIKRHDAIRLRKGWFGDDYGEYANWQYYIDLRELLLTGMVPRFRLTIWD